MKDVYFLHLDDQPDRINWIPRQFSSWIWRKYRDTMSGYPIANENARENTFGLQLQLNDGSVNVRYQIAVTVEAFRSLYQANEAHCAGVILDQWINGDKNAGATLYREIEEADKWAAARILMMSAYPTDMCMFLGWSLPHPQVLVKPPRQENLMLWLDRQLSVALAPAGRDEAPGKGASHDPPE